MVQVTFSFEGGTSGNTVAAGAGAGPGDTNFDAVTNASATDIYDNAHAAHGTLGNKIATAATSTTCFNAWTTSIGTQATVWVRAYLFFTGAPAVQHRVINFVGSAASRGNVLATTSGTLIFTNAAGGTVLTSAAFPLNAWFRLEAMFTGSAAAGQWEYKIWNSPDSAGAPDDTQTSAANLATGGTIDTYRFGFGAAVANAGPFWLDDAGVSTTAYLGPAVTAGAPAGLPLPGWLPGLGPGAPGAAPFTPWPQYVAGVLAGQDLLAAATTVTAAGAASLDVSKASAVPLPVYAPGWFPAAPSSPGGEPFAPWPVWLGATPKTDPLTAVPTITATGAAALTGAKPLNAAAAITATAAAALTESKPLSAPLTVTAAAAASLSVVKAGITPVPEYPPAWFPAAPGVPGGEPFAPWPVWSGFGGASVPQDLLTATATVTATGAAALTEAKPLNAASTVTTARAAALTGAKPLGAAQTVTAGRAAAEATAKPLNAAPVITAGLAAALAVQAAAPAAFSTASQYVPAWFPGAPGIPAAEAFAPWPPWTGLLTAPAIAVPPFTVGTLTAATGAAATLGARDAPTGVLTGSTAAPGALTAGTSSTGGPS